MWRVDGLRGLYRGFGAQLIASAPTHGVFWALYHRLVSPAGLPAWGDAAREAWREHAPAQMQQRAASSSLSLLAALPSAAHDGRNGRPTSSVGQETALHGTAAFVSGAAAVFVMNPLDVVKTRLQVEGTRGQTTASTFKELVAREGPRALWKGSSARVMAAAPTATLMIVYFESMKRLSAQTVLQRVDQATPDVMLTVHAEEKGEEQ